MLTTGGLLQASRRQRSRQDRVDDGVIPNVPLIALPTAAALVNIHLSTAVVALGLVATASLMAVGPTANRLHLTVASLIFPVGGMAITLRTNLPETQIGTIYSAVVCIVTALVASKSHSRSSAIVSLIDGVGLLLLAAIALRLAGIGGRGNAPVVMGNFLTGGERVFFTLTGSLINGPTLGAAYLVAAIPLIRWTRRYRTYRLVAVAGALYVLAQGDRRSALFTVILLLALAILTPRLLRKFAPWAIALALTGPFILKLTGSLPERLSFTQFQRVGEHDSESLNDRLQIWSRSLEFFGDKVDWYHQTIGYGTSGQLTSGAWTTYRNFFAGISGPAKSPHSSVIQMLFDGGWFSASGFVISIVCLAYVMSCRTSTADLASLAMLTLMSIVATTEPILAPGYPHPVWWTVMALGLIGFAKEGGRGNTGSNCP